MLSRRVGGFAGLGFVALGGYRSTSSSVSCGHAAVPAPRLAEVREVLRRPGVAVTRGVLDRDARVAVVWPASSPPAWWRGLDLSWTWSGWSPGRCWGSAGALMQNAIFAGVVGTQVVLCSREPCPSTTRSGLVWQLHNALFTLNGTSLALILLAFSVAGLRGGSHPTVARRASSHRRLRRARHLVVHHPLAHGRRGARAGSAWPASCCGWSGSRRTASRCCAGNGRHALRPAAVQVGATADPRPIVRAK